MTEKWNYSFCFEGESVTDNKQGDSISILLGNNNDLPISIDGDPSKDHIPKSSISTPVFKSKEATDFGEYGKGGQIIIINMWK